MVIDVRPPPGRCNCDGVGGEFYHDFGSAGCRFEKGTKLERDIVERLRDAANCLAYSRHPFWPSVRENIQEAADLIESLRSTPPVTEAMVATLLNGLEPEDTDAGWSAAGINRALSEPHSGDCTKQPWTCTRCMIEHSSKALQAALNTSARGK